MMVNSSLLHCAALSSSIRFYQELLAANTKDLRVEEPRYERDRSASPRPMKREDNFRSGRDRSASPNGRMNSR